MLPNYNTEFLTGTVYNWHHLLKDDNYKQILVDSFQWLVINKKCTINAFVVMPNHFHLVWKISDGFERQDVQAAMFSFTAHEFEKYLKNDKRAVVEKHFVNKTDRRFQFWEREPMVKECWTRSFFRQKLNYIHFNPCQAHWKLADLPEKYRWSSANFYETGIKEFSWLTHFNE